MNNLQERIRKAVRQFWSTRTRQQAAQGSASGVRDYGNRTATTGGKQLDGFVRLLAELLLDAGLPEECVFLAGRGDITLPGYFRPTKLWDLVVVAEGNLLAALECKSLCGPSFGNNYNNRIEEAIGSSTDIWTAYREGAFRQSPEPFIGYLLLLEEHPKSMRPVAVHEKHFAVFDEFRDSSYARRCEHSVRRLVRERCYSAGAFVIASSENAAAGDFSEPAADLTLERFVTIFCGHVRTNFDALELR